MKKIIILLWLLIIPVFAIDTLGADSVETLRVHYYRYDGNYSNFNIWMWEKEPGDLGGKQWDFDTNNIGDYGVYTDIDLAAEYTNTTLLGIIIKQGGWDGYREVGGDRFIEVSEIEFDDNGLGHAYFVEQDLNIGLSQDDLENNIPDYRDRILSANFIEAGANYAIEVSATAVIDSYEVIENNGATAYVSGTSTSRDVTINGTFNIGNSYDVKVTFSDATVATRKVSLEKIYDTQNFENLYTYEGDLGVSFDNDETIFRLWAPLSSEITLNLYNQGHPDYNDQGEPSEEDTPFETHAMEPIGQGAWEVKLRGDYDFKYYTFSINNGGITTEVTDPYAYSAGANALRSMIVNFEAINPDGWMYNDRPDTIEHNTDYIIWELHVRDLTTHSSWNGTESYRGTFMGLTERGTTYTDDNGVTVTTGLDHMIELGINAVHLLPIYDFGYVDEVEAALNPNYDNIFNWGYMPIHFNVLEGTYSTNPFDGKARVIEFKQAVMALHDAGIRVIMDVVYNHTGLSETSNFHQIVPGYYHRLNNSGGFSNGSGTGNETASERSMMRKFMLDSSEFLVSEYNLSGLRFDLMALHDYETMTLLGENLRAIDDSIIVYGEPWTGGTSELPSSLAAGKENIDQMASSEIAAFNDVIRDAVKGSVFNASEGGWVQGEGLADNFNKMMYGVVGGIDHVDVSYYDVWHYDPDQTVNYVSAHDNNTLYDKFMEVGFSLSNDLNRIKAMQIQSNAIVLTSQGIPFLHAGVEFMRSKPAVDGGYDHNSYESPDSTNQLRWDRKARYVDVFEYYKTLIYIRKAYDNFRMTEPALINATLSFLDTNQTYGGFAYRLAPVTDDQAEVIVIHSGYAPSGGYTIADLPDGKTYTVLTALGQHDPQGFETITDTAYVAANSTMILVDKVLEAPVWVAPEAPSEGAPILLPLLGAVLGAAALASIAVIALKKTKDPIK